MRIGVLGNEGSWYVNQLCAVAEQRGHQAVALQFPELQAGIRRGQSQLQIGDTDLLSLDVLLIRTMPPGSLEQVVLRMDMLAVAKQQGLRVINDPRAIECAVDKYLTTQKLAQAGLPVPDTVICESADVALEAFDQLGGDVVVKPVFGAEGRGILRIDQRELALRTFRTLERLNATLYLQRFLRGDAADLRILLLGGQLLAAMQRRPAVGDFRANAAQNGSCVPWTPSEEEFRLAQQAADVTGCIFAGVDLMRDEHGQLNVIEVNAVPGWRAIQRTCGCHVAERLFEWLETDLRIDDGSGSPRSSSR
ncbi:MAG: RimK family alpha-L-glutamate ligase [Planctomycetaceae bacterium]